MSTNKIEKMMKSMSNPRKWFDKVEEEGKPPEIFIYDQIGLDWWGEGLSAKSFIDEFNKIDSDSVNIHINSPGGLIYDGLAIYNAITAKNISVNMYIDGMAASTASFIAMAGDKIIMPENADFFIHDPWSCVCGNSSEMNKEAAELDRLKDNILNIYTDRTGAEKDTLKQMMTDETWISGSEAFELGFADEIIENKKAAACLFDIGIFNSVPEHITKMANATQKRDLEKSLRDAGYSNAMAKKIASGKLRDEESQVNKVDKNIFDKEEFKKEFKKWTQN